MPAVEPGTPPVKLTVKPVLGGDRKITLIITGHVGIGSNTPSENCDFHRKHPYRVCQSRHSLEQEIGVYCQQNFIRLLDDADSVVAEKRSVEKPKWKAFHEAALEERPELKGMTQAKVLEQACSTIILQIACAGCSSLCMRPLNAWLNAVAT